jgi:hypothetical protein
MTFQQQINDCPAHARTGEPGYACTVIFCYADDDVLDHETGQVIQPAGTLVWESHDDATIDPAERMNPDVPAYDYRAGHTGERAGLFP